MPDGWRFDWSAVCGALLAITLAGAGASAAEASASCDPKLSWEDGSVMRARYEQPAAVEMSLRRYANAIRLSFTGPDHVAKSIIDVSGGPTLLQGSDNAAEFTDAGMPVFMPVYYLRMHYPTPCAAPADERFDFRVEDDQVLHATVRVSGSVRRHDGGIDYDIAVEPVAGASSKPMRASGHWEHAVLEPIPEDLDVRGWRPVVQNWSIDKDAAPATIAQARQYHYTWKPAK